MRNPLRRRHPQPEITPASEPTGDWVIRSRHADAAAWTVRLGACTRAHAVTVVEQLEVDPTAPPNLYLEPTSG